MDGLSRRMFMSSAAGVTGGILMSGSLAAKSAGSRFPIGLELYSVSKEMIADLDGTLRKVAELGYREVELPSLYGRTPEQMRRALDIAGLNCSSFHIAPSSLVPGMISLDTDPDAVFAQCRDLGAKYAVCGLPPMRADQKPTLQAIQTDLGGTFQRFFDSLTLDDWKWNADFLNKYGEQAAKRGLALAYHNHNEEFRLQGDTSGYDELLRLTDSKLVKMELDCGWAYAAGRDPIALFAAGGPDRYRLLHLKEMKPAQGNSQKKWDPVEIGQGVVDWPKLLAAADRAGVRYAYIEQEPPYARPALDIVKSSLDYFKHLGRVSK